MKIKRNIYTAIVSLTCVATTLSSCSDWLDLYPSDEIKEEQMFQTGDGFRTALNGIYRKMVDFNLYGSNLSWGLIDAWGQCYYMEQAPDAAGGKAMKRIAKRQYKDLNLVPTTDALWTAAWNVVANCNNLAQQAEKSDPEIFYFKDVERQMILAEAIGLRAFVQFDLLRIYAPAPSSVSYAEDKRTFIPYVDSYPSYINDHQTVKYCLDKIINDLKVAQEKLLEVDKESNFAVSNRFDITTLSNDLFKMCRGYRLNYYAVTAELARVYLYAGMNKEAYTEAKKIIDSEQEKRYFKFTSSDYYIEQGNMKLYDDIIFGLYSPVELVEWDRNINHIDGDEYYLCIDSDVANELYGDELEDDWRFNYQLEEMYYGYYYRPLKYSAQPTNKDEGIVSNQTVPLIRMSEVYYIAAEAVFDTNKEEALDYLSRVKKGRGVRKTFDPTMSKSDFIDAIVSDARREFLGEGQTLYMFKRLNRNIPASSPSDDDVIASDENFVLPIPESEESIN